MCLLLLAAADESVEYVEPNFIYTKMQSNDPSIGSLWGMLATAGQAGANAVGKPVT
jgi:hypothetical protein